MTATDQGSETRRIRHLDIVREGDGDSRHGKLSTYNNHSCRCHACTAAMRAYGRELRERRKSARAAR
jgi:queuine/archaeosine tRNA-ribosyltransferase